MRRFFSRHGSSDLEAELREGRPEPRPELLDELVSRVAGTPVALPVRRPRYAAALVFAVVVVVALAAFGGVGYATSSIHSAAKSSGHAVTSVIEQGKSNKSDTKNGGNTGDDDDDNRGTYSSSWNDHDDPPWMHQYTRYVLVCYPFTITIRGREITVYRTIIVPRLFVDYFVPPGSRGACRLGPS